MLLTLCGFICCATAIDGVVQPILSLYRPLPTHLRDLSKEEKLRFAYLDGALCDAPQLQRLVSALHADVVLVTVKNKDSVALSSFAHNRFYPLEGGGVVVASRLSFDGEMVADFGDEALPALLVKLRTSQDTTLSISYLELLRAVDPYAFHVNRTTLRRVATQFRNMDEAGLLVTKLRTPIFSKFYGLLVNYGNVRNVWRDTPALQSIARAWFEIPFADTQFLVNLGISGVTPEHILDEDKKVVGTAYSFSTRAFTS